LSQRRLHNFEPRSQRFLVRHAPAHCLHVVRVHHHKRMSAMTLGGELLFSVWVQKEIASSRQGRGKKRVRSHGRQYHRSTCRVCEPTKHNKEPPLGL
jgi:hypothetical protein